MNKTNKGLLFIAAGLVGIAIYKLPVLGAIILFYPLTYVLFFVVFVLPLIACIKTVPYILSKLS